MAMFRKPAPKTGSAAVARERLLWCAFFDNNRRGRVFNIPVWMLKEWTFGGLGP